MRALRLVAICVVLALVPAGETQAAGFRDGHGLTVVSVKRLDARLFALEVRTRALPGPANVYVLLPPGYDSQPRRRWPVLYLLHGTSGTASDWTRKGDAEKVIGDSPLITVMPDIALDNGGGGWCSDWPNGVQRWETFHIDQLIPWVDANLRTRRSRGKRAIAGLSQGGFCSLSYAARHPDLFGAAVGYSAAPDIYYDPELRAGALLIIGGTEMGLDHVPPGTFFGDPFTNGINWAAHDPATIAENLRSSRVFMYWGNGAPGPLDDNAVGGLGGASEIEAAVAQSNAGFKRRLESLRIPAYFNAYGAGTHSWPYWTRDLAWSLPKVMDGFAHPAPRPARFTYTSADDRYDTYGWTIGMHRQARELSTLAATRCSEFAVSGSGTAVVTTPPCLRRGRRYRVTLTGPNADASSVVRSRRGRRLTLTVPLGPSNPYQQETAQAQAAGTNVYTTSVTVRPA